MENLDFVQTMIDMITSVLDFLFQWLSIALANSGRVPLDNAIR